MHVRSAWMILTVTLSFALTGCGGGGSTPASPSSPPVSSPQASGPTITIPAGDGYGGGSNFTPANITIQAGASVTWNNQDSVAHVSAAATGDAWSATIEPGGSYGRTFANRGTFNYRCTIHQGMSGTVTVQ